MTQATLWHSIATRMVPPDAPLIRTHRARWLLDEAAVWRGDTGTVGVLWRFEDGSAVCANEARDWVILPRTVP